jgi:secreted protein with Ig-like and vWFA domain
LTRQSPRKRVDSTYAEGRLQLARSYLGAARTEATLIAPGDIGNPAMSQVVLAAIAYADALCARHAGYVNQQNHAAAVQTLRDAMGNRLPTAQATRLGRIIGEKDDVQYGVRPKTSEEAQRSLEQLEEFASWAEEELQRPV